VYADDCRFSAEVALKIAKGIASAAEHLHQQGITHGDLYGHNILLNDQGDCLLGDFGAASFHATTDNLETRALQRIEVRAFGVLLGELLARIDSGLSDEQRETLQALEQRCCQPDVRARPGFGEVIRILHTQ
ncbi:protein kinase, partial [Pseudomonas sp. HMWF021]|uniref:protein kinase domain-containing protein n=1 Tax=Pseudomonas sp. HMWF021 TaxID=2056857 RepID=UPI000D48C2DF